jgi:hypothetical protein
VTDTAALTGGSVPGGSVEFKLYGPSATADCSGTPVDDETVTVSGNGSYTTPAGATPTQPGTYWWTAAYSGDPNNNPAATNCGDEQVTITSSAHLYWTDGAGTVNEANLDGSNPHVIATGQPIPGGVAVNSTSLYWSDQNGIMQAGLDGSNPHLIVTHQAGVLGIAVNGSNLYWAINSNGTVWEAGLDGSNPHPIGGPQLFPGAVAVNGSNVYWADAGGAPGTGTITEASLDGSNAHVIVGGRTGGSILAVDSSHLYWTGSGTITEAGLDGSNPQTIITGINPSWMAVSPQ